MRKIIKGISRGVIIALIIYLLFGVWVSFSFQNSLKAVLNDMPSQAEQDSTLINRLNFRVMPRDRIKFNKDVDETWKWRLGWIRHNFTQAHFKLYYRYKYYAFDESGDQMTCGVTSEIEVQMKLINGKWVITYLHERP